MELSAENIKKIKASLYEDVRSGDVTSNRLIPAQAQAFAVIIAKENGVFCGGPIAGAVFKLAGSALQIQMLASEGEKIRAGQKVIQIKGNVRAILKGERTALNFLGRLSGIATRTRVFALQVKKYGTRVLDTRKTTPLWREFEKYAVKTGGGTNHRMGLYDAVFVKENHRLLGDLKKLKKLRGNFEIEVRNDRELSEALMLGPKVILFDNFQPKELKRLVLKVRTTHPKIILEASGGVTEKNIRQFAAAGVDQVSIGALTHSVRCFDFSLLIEKEKL